MRTFVDVMLGDRFIGQFSIEVNPIFPLTQEEIKYEACKRFSTIKGKRNVTFAFGNRKPNR